jgi:hypothetical protein
MSFTTELLAHFVYDGFKKAAAGYFDGLGIQELHLDQCAPYPTGLPADRVIEVKPDMPEPMAPKGFKPRNSCSR